MATIVEEYGMFMISGIVFLMLLVIIKIFLQPDPNPKKPSSSSFRTASARFIARLTGATSYKDYNAVIRDEYGNVIRFKEDATP